MITVLAAILALASASASAGALPVVRSHNASTFLVTMYAVDPQSNSVDLLSALSGSVAAGFTQYNSNSDITYGPYTPGYMVSGVQGGDVAAFIDLGPTSNLIGKDDCDTVPAGQYFTSIHVSEGQVKVVDTCGTSNTCPQTFRNISGLEAALQRTESGAKAWPVPGHMYILRIANQATRLTRAMFKILVVDVGQGNRSVTFRYGILDHKQEAEVQCCDENNENKCANAPRNLVFEQGPPGQRGVAPSPSAAPSSAPQANPVTEPVTGGELAGAAVGSVAVSVMAVGGMWYCLSKRSSPDEDKRLLVSAA